MDGRINQALLCGNIEVAVYLCLENERWADALLLATRGTPELMTKAQAKYFQVSIDFPFTFILTNSLTNDMDYILGYVTLGFNESILIHDLFFHIRNLAEDQQI